MGFEEWLAFSERDLSTAEYNLKGSKTDAAIFFCHQSVEKALKALYIKKYGELVKIHDLVILGKKTNLPEEFIEFCKILSPAYVFTRYPDIEGRQGIDELAKEFIVKTRLVVEWVKKNL